MRAGLKQGSRRMARGRVLRSGSGCNAAFAIRAELDVILPGMARGQAGALVAEARHACPYSTATRVNIDVILNVV